MIQFFAKETLLKEQATFVNNICEFATINCTEIEGPRTNNRRLTTLPEKGRTVNLAYRTLYHDNHCEKQKCRPVKW